MARKQKQLAHLIAIASSVIAMKAGISAGQTTFTWNGNAGDGIWNTGVSQGNWDGGVYSPGNGGGNNFVFVDPLYNQSVSTITLTGGHNPNIDNLNISSSVVTPLTIVIAGGNAGTHMDMEVPAGVDTLDVFASGVTINSTTVNGIQGQMDLYGSSGLWNVSGSNVFTINAPIADTGLYNRGFDKIGTGTLVLGAQSPFDGDMNVQQGTAQFQYLANVGFNSSAGTGTGSTSIQIGYNTSSTFLSAAVVYNGSNTSTNRPFVVAQDFQTSATDSASLTSLANTLTLTGGITTASVSTTNYTNFDIGGAGNIIVSNVGVSGYLSLIKTGTGLVQLNAASTYKGSTNVTAGTLTVSAADNTTPLFTVASGANLNITGSGTILATAPISNAGTINFNSGIAGSFGGVISSTGSLAVSGSMLTVSGTNTYSGGTNVTGGTLIFKGGASVPSTGTIAVAAGATLSFADGTARTTTVPSLSLASGAGIGLDYLTNTTDQIALTSAPTVAGNVVINMAATTPTAGTYSLITAPSGLNNGTYLLANATNFTGTLSATSTAVTLTTTTAGVTALTNAYWYGGQVAGALNAMGLSAGNTSNWSINASDSSATAMGVVPGSGTSVFFSNTNGGATQESNIVLGANMTVNRLTFNDPIPVTIAADGNAITLMNTSTGVNSAISVNSSATINANINLGASQTWTAASGQTLTVGGSINGAFGLSLAGSGAFTLNGQNYYTGTTNVSAGTLNVGSTGYLAGSSVNASAGATVNFLPGSSTSLSTALIDNGTVNLNNSSPTFTTITGAGSLNLNGAALTISGGTFSGTINSIGSLAAIGGTLILAGNDTYTGGTNVSVGATVTVASTGSLYSSTVLFDNGTVNFNNASQSIASLNSGNVVSKVVLNSAALSISGGGTYTGIISGNGSLNIVGGTFDSLGANTFTGSTNVSAGTLIIDSGGALASTSVSVSSGATLNDATGGVLSASTALLDNGTVTIGANTQTLASVDGTGTLNVSGSTLTVLATGSPSSAVSLIDTGTVILEAPSQTLTTLNGTGKLNLSGTALTVTGGGTFSGAISNTGSLNISGGTLTLLGASTYTGPTTIVNSKVIASATGLGNASSGIYIDNATLNVSSGSMSFSNVSHPVMVGPDGATFYFYNGGFTGNGISGSGPITLAGGTMSVGANSSTYDGYVTLLAGRLYFTSDQFPLITGMNVASGAYYNIVDNGSPTYNFAPGASLIINGNGVAGSSIPGAFVVSEQSGLSVAATFANPVQLAGNSSIGVYNGVGGNVSSLVISKVISGPYLLTKLGDGALKMTASNSYSGGTQVSQGVLTGTVTGAFGSGDLLIAPTGTASADYAAIVNSTYSIAPSANVTVDSNNALASGTLNLFGKNEMIGSLSGNSVYSSVYLGNSSGTSLTTGNSNSTTFAGVISDSVSNGGSGVGSLIIQGTGTFTLTNVNNYSGGTFVNSGTLVLTTTGALPLGTNLSIGSVATSATVMFSNHSGANPGVLSTNNLNFAGTNSAWNGRLDLTNNAMIVHSGSIGTVFNQIAQGYNGGAWNGTGGIISSAAASDTTHLTALGVMVNDQGGANSGSPIYNSFEGMPTVDGDVLVKYTYYGDTNLDGVVDGSDYSRIDAAFLADQTSPGSVTGWANGDFNYDGVINGSDYTLIDNAFNSQGTQISTEIATATAQIAGQSVASGPSSAVPEPASLGMMSLFAIGLLGRRRRCR
jgi:fibronectin-binding autotransporter adhesin